jgi:hypothetical protein
MNAASSLFGKIAAAAGMSCPCAAAESGAGPVDAIAAPIAPVALSTVHREVGHDRHPVAALSLRCERWRHLPQISRSILSGFAAFSDSC